MDTCIIDQLKEAESRGRRSKKKKLASIWESIVHRQDLIYNSKLDQYFNFAVCTLASTDGLLCMKIRHHLERQTISHDSLLTVSTKIPFNDHVSTGVLQLNP